MGMFSACKKSAIALLLGIVGLCAAPAGAQKPPRLLFLGINKDGHGQQQAERVVQLRLEGLDLLVIRPKELPILSCEQADCLSAAMAREGTELALTARILKNEHACLATLLLVTSNKPGKPIEQDISCRPDGREDELIASLADGASAIIDDYLRTAKPPLRKMQLESNIKAYIVNNNYINEKKKSPMKKRILFGGLSVLLVGGIITTITLTALRPDKHEDVASHMVTIDSYGPGIAIAGIGSGIVAGSLLTLSIK